METIRTHAAAESPNAPQSEEHELIAQARGDGKEAFGELYTWHVSDVERQVRSNVGSKEDAEDIAQEAFIRTYRRIGEFEDRGKGIRPYLGRIARNLCVDWARQRQNRPQTTSSEGQQDAAFAKLPAPDNVEQQALDALEPFSPEVRVALDELQHHNSDLYQAAIAVCVHGKKYREYAEETGLPLNTVRTRVHRAKQALRKNLMTNDGMINTKR